MAFHLCSQYMHLLLQTFLKSLPQWQQVILELSVCANRA